MDSAGTSSVYQMALNVGIAMMTSAPMDAVMRPISMRGLPWPSSMMAGLFSSPGRERNLMTA